MTQVLDDLVALLSLEKIEENLFRGGSQDLGFRQLFRDFSEASQSLFRIWSAVALVIVVIEIIWLRKNFKKF